MSAFNVQILLRLVDQLTGPSKRISQNYRSMQQNITSASRSMSTATNQSTAGLNRMSTAANTANGSVHRLARSMRNLRTVGHGLGGGMLPGFGGGLIGFGIGRTLFRFEDVMNHVEALTGADEGAMADLRAEVVRIGQESRYTVTQVGEGLVELARAGVYDPKQAKALLDGVVLLSEAVDAPMDRAADIVTNITKSFGKAIQPEIVSKMVDSISQAVRRTNFDVTELAESLKYSAFNAHKFGMSMDDTTAILMTLAQRGIKGSTAGTGFSRIVEGALSMNATKLKALAAIGVDHKEFFDENGNIDFFGMIETFREAEQEFGKVKLGEALVKTFGVRGSRIMMALTESSAEEIANFRDIMDDAEGAAWEMRIKRMKGLPGAWYRMVAAIQAATLSMGDKGGLTGTLDQLATRIKEISLGFTKLDPVWQKLISHSVLGATAISALAIPIWITSKAVGFLAGGLFKLARGGARIVSVFRPLAHLLGRGLLGGLIGGMFLGLGKLSHLTATIYRFAGALGVATAAFRVLRRALGIGLAVEGLILLHDNWSKLKELARDPLKFNIIFPGAPEWLKWLFVNSEKQKVEMDKSMELTRQRVTYWLDAASNWIMPGDSNDYGMDRWAPAFEGIGNIGVPEALRRRPDEIDPSASATFGNGKPSVATTNSHNSITNHVTVNVQTNADPGAIGSATANAVGNKVRGALSDAPHSAP